MNTLVLNLPGTRILDDSDVMKTDVQEGLTLKDIILDEKIEARSDCMSFRVLVLQRNWVKDVISLISEEDLMNLLEADRYQMIHIKQKIKEKGICRFRKRIGFLKYLVYEIQNWWDYDSGL